MPELSREEKNAKFKFVEITFLTKVEKSILNTAGNFGGNLTELKKTTEIDDTKRVFVSGQSLKWSIKKYWVDTFGSKYVSPIVEKTTGAQISSKCQPDKYWDDDLFGYFNTGTNLARFAPVKTSGMISVFDKQDVHIHARYSKNTQNHSLFEKETSTNVFRSSWAIELDRIGIATKKPTAGTGEVNRSVNLSKPEKEKRVKALFLSLFNLWQRVQQSNNLTNTQPDLMTIIFRNDKSLAIGDKLRIDTQYNLNIDALVEALQYHKREISLAYVAANDTFLSNFDEMIALNAQANVCNNLHASHLVELKRKILDNSFKFFK